jgi:hypothetical protein
MAKDYSACRWYAKGRQFATDPLRIRAHHAQQRQRPGREPGHIATATAGAADLNAHWGVEARYCSKVLAEQAVVGTTDRA